MIRISDGLIRIEQDACSVIDWTMMFGYNEDGGGIMEAVVIMAGSVSIVSVSWTVFVAVSVAGGRDKCADISREDGGSGRCRSPEVGRPLASR